MAFKFPFSTLHELNLDWILEKVKTFAELIPPMESAVEDVQTSLTTAQEALEDATEALDSAGQALETAEEAKEIAEQAASGTIADGAVTTPKLADDAVTFAKIADGAVTGSKIDLATIQTGNLSEGCVTSNKILDGTVDTVDMHDGAITTPKIADGNVTLAKLASNALPTTGTGYWKSPDGLLICWGTVSVEREPGVNTATAAYAQTFSGHPFFAAAMYQSSHPESWEYGVSDFESPTLITLKLYNAASSALSNADISYIAIGFAA